MSGVTRRQFVSGCAAASAAAVGGVATAANASPISASQITWDYETEVVIVGGGCAGWGAVYEATQAGASVIQIEKTGALGGDMVINAGILPGWGTEYTQAAGVEATTEQMWEEYLATDDPLGTPPQDVMKYVYENCGQNIDFFANAGVEWTYMGLQEWYSQYPVFFQAGYGDLVGGASFREPMLNSIAACGIEPMLNTRAQKLITNDDGRVVGVQAHTESGDINIKATRGVILATGGYTSNSKLISIFAEQYQGMGSAAREHNIGDKWQPPWEPSRQELISAASYSRTPNTRLDSGYMPTACTLE